MWNYTIKAEVVTGRFSRQVETFSVQAKDLTDAMIQIEKNAKIGRVIHSTSVKNKDNKMNTFLYGFYSFVKLDECVQAYELGHPVECDGDNNRAEIHENKEA